MTPDARTPDTQTPGTQTPDTHTPDTHTPDTQAPNAVNRHDGLSREAPPRTGDAETDAALEQLDRVRSGSLAERIETGEQVHELLRGRLGDLGGP